MSIKVCLDNLSEELKTNIARNLQFTPKETKYGPSDKVVCAFDIEDNDVYLPLYFAQKSLKLEQEPSLNESTCANLRAKNPSTSIGNV